MKRDDVARLTIPHSYSHAWRLGQAVLHARANKLDPVTTILKHEGGKLLCTGKVGLYYGVKLHGINSICCIDQNCS